MSRTRIQYRSSGSRAMKSMSGWRSSPAMDAQKALRDGCEVRSAMDAMAKSMTSHPALDISKAVARDALLVAWVWKWIGRSHPSRMASTSGLADRGLRSPAMSLMPWGGGG